MKRVKKASPTIVLLECDQTSVFLRVVQHLSMLRFKQHRYGGTIDKVLTNRAAEDLPVFDEPESQTLDKLIQAISLNPLLAYPRPDLPFAT